MQMHSAAEQQATALRPHHSGVAVPAVRPVMIFAAAARECLLHMHQHTHARYALHAVVCVANWQVAMRIKAHSVHAVTLQTSHVGVTKHSMM